MNLLPDARTFGSFHHLTWVGISLDKELKQIHEHLTNAPLNFDSEMLIDLQTGEIAVI